MSKPIHISITPASRPPKAAEVKRLMSRSALGKIPDRAIEQAITVVPILERWLADHPDAATQLLHDPAAMLEGMRHSGALAESVDDLLALLRSALPNAGDATSRTRALVAGVFRSATASFGPARKKGER